MNESNAVDDFLEHVGVKGMRWGHRRAEKRSAKASEKDRLHFDNLSKNTRKQIYTRATEQMYSRQKLIDEKYEGKNLYKDSMIRNKYLDETAEAFAGELDKALVKVTGSNKSPSGKYQASFEVNALNPTQARLVVYKLKEITHEDNKVEFNVEFDENGFVIGYKLIEDLVQTDIVGDFLEHVGVKGMRWGVRRARSARSKGKASPRPSDEGKAAAKILDKQKRFGTSALTNHELRVLNARAKLEKEFNSNFPKPQGKIKKGESYVKEVLAVAGTAGQVYTFVKSPAGQAAIKRGKKLMGSKVTSIPMSQIPSKYILPVP